jgi:phage shock protein PspC (stress-responsive transcriptional regulator)
VLFYAVAALLFLLVVLSVIAFVIASFDFPDEPRA